MSNYTTTTLENELPHDIYDAINLENINPRKFLQERGNIIFKIKDKDRPDYYFPTNLSYFHPIDDTYILFDCENKSFGELIRDYHNNSLVEYLNMEKIGIKIP